MAGNSRRLRSMAGASRRFGENRPRFADPTGLIDPVQLTPRRLDPPLESL
jgi:hypothetical protein